MTMDMSSTQKQIVAFEVAGESFGVDISAVQEIIRLQTVTDVPKAPMHVKGVINLRGQVIAVVDLRDKFGFSRIEETKSTRIVVVDVLGSVVGLVVDAVSEVLMIGEEQIEQPSSIIESYDRYLNGIGKLDERLILLLDLERLVPEAAQLAIAA